MWSREEKEEKNASKEAMLTSGGGAEEERLRSGGIRLQQLKVGKAGITEGIVNGLHERW